MRKRKSLRKKFQKSYLFKKHIAIALIALFIVAILPMASNLLKESTKTSAIEGVSDVAINETPVIPQSINVNLTGQVFNDANCNNVKEVNENGISDVKIAILNLKSEYDVEALEVVTSDAHGNYSFSKSMLDNESITVQPVPGVNLVHEPLKVNFNTGNRSSIVDLSHCP